MSNPRWLTIDYLQEGSPAQVEVHRIITGHRLLDKLRAYDPILVGTLPIGIQIAGSDLDIICEVHDFTGFEELVKEQFRTYPDFAIQRKVVGGLERIKVNVTVDGWPVELFGQNRPTTEQNGFVHMVIEARMLEMYGKAFTERIIALKAAGLKTEPAFAAALGLEGDPYERLLDISRWTDEDIRRLWKEPGTDRS
ncbi:DUF4269 domain-containing protein [Paenibacillus filicis]|uniref:DUF4269 domain-containing protein n=1 Tax=Paenibacillus filicis TaxID=669464 RepID=A0ABU9DJ76_9BACL